MYLTLNKLSYLILYKSSFLDTDELKMTLRARKVSGFFEKLAPGCRL